VVVVRVHTTDRVQQVQEVQEVAVTPQYLEVEVMVQQTQDEVDDDELQTLDERQYEFDETDEVV
jgi:hypothetical protein